MGLEKPGGGVEKTGDKCIGAVIEPMTADNHRGWLKAVAVPLGTAVGRKPAAGWTDRFLCQG